MRLYRVVWYVQGQKRQTHLCYTHLADADEVLRRLQNEYGIYDAKVETEYL